jgi:hypothetical protein
MKTRPLIEWLIYTVIVALSVIAIGLVVSSPPDFIETKPVYGGF